jgi:hypothetical protein
VSDILAIGLGGAVGAATAVLAQRGDSYYHDAIRPLARDLRSAKTSREELSRYAWGVSWRFVAFFAIPFALLTGAVVAHLLFLPAEALAIRLARSSVAAVAGALLGAAAVAATIGVHDALGAEVIGLAQHLRALVDPVLWLYPLVPVLAAVKLPRPVLGTTLAGGAAGVTAAALALADGHAAVAPAAAIAATVALLTFHLAISRPGPAVPLEAIGAGAQYVRRGLPLLLVSGGAVAALGAEHRLAGDPLAAVLISSGHQADAAVVALLIGLAFLPMVAVSSVASDSYSTQGTPDALPAAGYLLSGLPAIAGPVGALLMTAEVSARRRTMRLVMSRPIVSELATALRDAIGDVALLALTVGGLMLAAAVAGPLGFLAAGAAWLLNEQVGRPVTRLAVTPAAAIVVALAAELWRTIP